jgi:hypothetical protein
MPGGNGGKHGGDNLQGREGHRKVGETEGEQGDDNLKCGGRLEMAGENGICLHSPTYFQSLYCTHCKVRARFAKLCVL